MTVREALQEGFEKGFRLDESPGTIELDAGEIALLCERGFLASGDYYRPRYMQQLKGGLTLIVSAEAQDNLWDYEEPESIAPFVSGMFLGFAEPDGTLRLLSQESLWALLPKYREEMTGAGIKTPIAGWSLELVQNEENFCGRCYVCDFTVDGIVCGEPMCSSGFCWKENGSVLLYIETGDEVSAVWLYPELVDENR